MGRRRWHVACIFAKQNGWASQNLKEFNGCDKVLINTIHGQSPPIWIFIGGEVAEISNMTMLCTNSKRLKRASGAYHLRLLIPAPSNSDGVAPPAGGLLEKTRPIRLEV
jgi:hypothetical protein